MIKYGWVFSLIASLYYVLRFFLLGYEFWHLLVGVIFGSISYISKKELMQ
jgi:hypothetical protein